MKKISTKQMEAAREKFQKIEEPAMNEAMDATDDEFDYAEEGTCCICGGRYFHWGNNPEPVMRWEDGRCCDDCNATVVIRERILRIQQYAMAKKIS